MNLDDFRGLIPAEFRWQTLSHDEDTRDMIDLFEDGSLNKCHKIIDTECPADDESWDCTDGNAEGSSCTKSCSDGLIPAGGSSTKSCECTKKCKWEPKVLATCQATTCQLPSPRDWPDEVECKAANNERLDFATYSASGFPQGAACRKKCPEGKFASKAQWEKKHSFFSTCECSSNGKCRFDAANLGSACLNDGEGGWDFDLSTYWAHFGW